MGWHSPDFAQSLHESSDPLVAANESIRNHFTGIVTKVVKDKVMAQVELQAGPFRDGRPHQPRGG
jgi:hypothetical protein